MRCVAQIEQLFAAIKDFTYLIERDDAALVRGLIKLRPIKIRGRYKAVQVTMPRGTSGVLAVGILGVEKNNGVVRFVFTSTGHNEDGARHGGQDIATGKQMHEAGSASALFVRLRLARMRINTQGGFIHASWEQVAKRIEGFEVVTLLVVTRRCVPGIAYDDFGFERLQCRAD